MIDYLARAMEQEEETQGERVLSAALREVRISPPQAERGEESESLPKAAGENEETPPLLGRDTPTNPTGTPSVAQRAFSPEWRNRALPVAQAVAAALSRQVREVGGTVERARSLETVPLPLLSALRRAETGTDFVRRERRNLSVTLPEAPAVAGSLSAEELDRTVERDARRYDGGFSLY